MDLNGTLENEHFGLDGYRRGKGRAHPPHLGPNKAFIAGGLSWLTNSALVYEFKCGGMGEGRLRASTNEYSCTHGAQINFGDLTPCLTYVL
jgi:hypothetical protein